MNKNKIIEIIEEFAPLELQEPWDNSGWQIKTPTQNIESIMLCVSPTEDVITQALEQNINLLISHHPLIFPSITSINDEKIITAIKNDLQIYSAHTNFDRAHDGTSAYLARALGFKNLHKLNDFVQIAQKTINIDDFILQIKLTLNIEKLKVINYASNKTVNKIAFCAGSGGAFIDELNSTDIDLFVTSDIKYHDALNAKNITIIDVGHLESERPALSKLEELLEKQKLQIVSANEKNIPKYI